VGLKVRKKIWRGNMKKDGKKRKRRKRGMR
jgi:serine/threonine protein kinase